MTDAEILERFGPEAGAEILRLTSERDNALRLNEEMTNQGRMAGSATFWRDRYFRLFDQLGAIADVVGAPRASNYEQGHVLAAVKEVVQGRSGK